MARNLARPFFPVPPKEYDQRYMATIMESFSLYLQQQQNPGEMRGTKLTLTDLPTSVVGTEFGTLFQRDGIVHVHVADNAFPDGVSGSGAVGTVSVSTT